MKNLHSDLLAIQLIRVHFADKIYNLQRFTSSQYLIMQQEMRSFLLLSLAEASLKERMMDAYQSATEFQMLI